MGQRGWSLLWALLLPAAAFGNSAAPFARITLGIAANAAIADYQLARPVTTLKLKATDTEGRKRSWTVLTPNVALEAAQLVSTNGKPFQRVLVKVRLIAGRIDREYSPLVPFTDGGLALYTGQFDVDESLGASRFLIRGSAQLPVTVQGRTSTQTRTLLAGHEGTYVYFGHTKPLATEGGVAILDPGLPPWALNELRSFLPKVLAYYGTHLGKPVNEHPYVLFSYQPAPDAGNGLTGEVLHGVVRYELDGQSMAADTTANRADLRRLFAHEAAHFWNMGADDGKRVDWLSEGSAETFAERALHELGYTDDAQWNSAQERAINQCLLDDTRTGINGHAGKLPYDCGNFLSLLTDAALQQAGGGHELFGFWRELLQLDPSGNGHFRQQDYFDHLSQQTGQSQLSALMEGFVERGSGLQSLVTEAFASAGRPLALTQEPDAAFAPNLYGELMAHLMQQDCHGSVDFNSLSDRIVTGNRAQCTSLKPNFAITAIAGYPLYQHPLAAIQAVTDACTAARPVELQGETVDQVLSLPCTQAPPPAPRFVRFAPLAP